jgi:hypothetical protein
MKNKLRVGTVLSEMIIPPNESLAQTNIPYLKFMNTTDRWVKVQAKVILKKTKKPKGA